MIEKVLEIKNLKVEYASDKKIVRAVNNLDLEINKGEVLGLVGETGAGKTTTALSVMGLVPNPPGKVVGGEILYKRENLLAKSEREMRKVRGYEISMIFQDPMTALNPMWTVGKQIAEVIRLHENVSKDVAYIKAKQMMEIVGIPGERADEYPHQLSGGMKQRIVIAIALACNPSLLIADEPTTALDVTIQAQVLELMEELIEKYNTSLLMITHDLGVVAEICDEVAIMYAGEIVEHGSLEQIYNNTKHPYTEGLFSSIPNFNENVERLNPIPGLMPDLTELPIGCSFADRCKYVTAECREQRIPVYTIELGHTCRCIRFKG